MEEETIQTNFGAVEEKINDAKDSIGDTEGDLSKEHREVVEKLKKIIVEDRTNDSIMFKKVNKKVL